MGDRLGSFPAAGEDYPQLIVCLRVIGPVLDGGTELLRGLAGLSLSEQKVSQPVVGLGVAGFQAQGGGEVCCGLVGFAEGGFCWMN